MPLPHIEMGYFISSYVTLLFFSSLQCHRTNRGERELLVAKLLIVHINNKATETLNKSDPLEAYPSDSFRWNRMEPVRMKPGAVWTRGTRFRQG